MERKYTKEELNLISEISKVEAYISTKEAVQIALNHAKMPQPYPKYEVDFDYEKTFDLECPLEARYQVNFTLNYRTYCYTIKATTGEILDSNIDHTYKGSFFKDGVSYLKYADENNFTSDLGMKIRSHTYEKLKTPLLKATDGNINLESYKIHGEESIVNTEKDLSFLNLESNKPYIFVSTHSFCEDINTALAIMDRNAYLLFGSTDQLEHAKEVYGLWAMGMVYVNRIDPWSRNNSLLKMARAIKNGTSVIICIEGGYNNTENRLLEEFFNGPFILQQMTNASIVPIASFREYRSPNIYVTADKPKNYLKMPKEEAKAELRDTLATMMFDMWLHHGGCLVRRMLPWDYYQKFMEERKSEYVKSHWTHDVWDEELTRYYNPLKPRPEDVWATFDNVKITKENKDVMTPILVRRKNDLRHDFKKYMKETWNK